MAAEETVIEAGRAESQYWRDLLTRYKQTAFGVAWAVVRPLLSTAILTFVFSNVADLPSGAIPYALFVFAAQVPWQFFANALNDSSTSLVGNAHLVTKVYFPRIILPAASVLASLLDFAVGVVVLLAVLLVRRELPSAGSLALVPLFMLLLQLLGLGVGFFSAALTVRFRDVQYVLPFLIQLLLYASPVAYGITAVPPAVRRFYLLNPVAPLLDGLRTALLGRGELHWLAIGTSAAVSAATFALGTLFLLHQDRQYADVI